MTTRSWIRKLFARTPRTLRKAPARFRPRVEALEDRVTPSTFNVTSLADDGSAGTLRQAIDLANAQPGGDTITFAPALAGSTIETVNLAITDDVDIQGPLNGPVILSGPSPLFHQFMGGGRILDIAAGVNVSISRLSLMNGDATNPDPFNPTGEAFGGAIRNAGTLTVRQCLFYHNGAGEPNSGIGGGGGGAIYNSGSLTVIASSFAANFADWGSGGAIYNAGTATVTNSTFIDNYTGRLGGAIFNDTGRTLTIDHSTILKSGGDPQAPVLGLPLGQHGIANLGTMAMNNTIVADTPVGSDVVNTFIITGSHNLIKDGSGGLPGPNFTGDPMLAAPDYTQASSRYPALALLPRPGQYGPPFTFSPLPGSPAIDAGNNGAVSSFVDQRGAPRINNGVVDIGAVEVPVAPVGIVVTTLADENNDSIDPALGAGTSLREALWLMLPEDVTITFAPGLAGVVALDASLGSLQILDFHVTVPSNRGDVTIVGPGADVITIDGLNQVRILELAAYNDVAISGLTFARGTANGFVNGGGAIYQARSKLTVSDCAFIDNTAANFGGAIHGEANELTVNNCTFVGNFADEGGAIKNERRMTVTDSTFIGNFARRGGAIWAQYFNNSVDPFPFIRPTVTSSTFSENSAGEYGGAILISSYRGFGWPAELAVINSTISNNSAGLNGGGIFVAGDLALYGSTVYGNSAASAGPTVAGGIAIADLPLGAGSYVEMVTLVNNIVAGSTSGADLTVFTELDGIVTGSHNLIGDGSGGLPNTITGDPLLGPLADNGGPTKTHALLPFSPAIDAGDPAFDPNAFTPPLVNDQRGSGFSRIRGGTVDLGAFEVQDDLPTITRTLDAVTINEGADVTNSGGFNDPQGRDTVTVTASLGTVTKNDAAGTWSWSYTPPDGPNGPITVTITATDDYGLTATTTFTLTVNNVAPTVAISGAASVNEGAVYTLTLGAVTDPGADTVTQYVVHWGDGTSDTYTTAGDKTHVYTAGGVTRAVTVDLIDEDGTHLDRANDLSVYVNAAPTDIALSNSSVAENQPSGTGVGTFTTTDPDSGNSHTYTLVAGAGADDNASFTIDAAGNLKTAAAFDFEAKSSYSIRVRSTDSGGLWTEKVFTVSVTDVNEAPSVVVPAAQTGYEDVDLAITGITVADPEGSSLTVTLSVSHGRLTLGTTAGLTVTGDGSGAVSLSGSIANLNAALASLVYRGNLNYSGNDTLSITAGDSSLSTSGSVAIEVKSALQQAAELQARVEALRVAGVLGKRQANTLIKDLSLKGNAGDVGKVEQFLADVASLRNDGVLTQAQADDLLSWGNILLLSVSRR